MPTDNRPYTLGDAADALSTFGQYLKDAAVGPDYPEVPESPYARQAKVGFDWYAPPAFIPYLLKAGQRYNLDPRLLDKQYNQESRFNPKAVGSKGERGIAQLMPATARQLGVTRPTDPEQSIMGGAKYLAHLVDQFGGDLTKALAAYNVGPGNVARGKKTDLGQQYVSAVLTPKRYGR